MTSQYEGIIDRDHVRIHRAVLKLLHTTAEKHKNPGPIPEHLLGDNNVPQSRKLGGSITQRMDNAERPQVSCIANRKDLNMHASIVLQIQHMKEQFDQQCASFNKVPTLQQVSLVTLQKMPAGLFSTGLSFL